MKMPQVGVAANRSVAGLVLCVWGTCDLAAPILQLVSVPPQAAASAKGELSDVRGAPGEAFVPLSLW